RSLKVPEPVTVNVRFVPAGALSVAFNFKVVSAVLAGILSRVATIPAGKPSTIRATSLVKPARRSILILVSVSLAADSDPAGNAVTDRRESVLESRNGNCVIVTG